VKSANQFSVFVVACGVACPVGADYIEAGWSRLDFANHDGDIVSIDSVDAGLTRVSVEHASCRAELPASVLNVKNGRPSVRTARLIRLDDEGEDLALVVDYVFF
jgi:hypothetical protein